MQALGKEKIAKKCNYEEIIKVNIKRNHKYSVFKDIHPERKFTVN